MRVLVLQEFGKLVVQQRDIPVPGPGQALVAVIATGICGSDIHGFTGANGRRVAGQVMGHESVGRIAALGPDATAGELRQGRLVTFNPVVIPKGDQQAYAGREQHSPGRSVIGVDPTVQAAFADFLLVPIHNVVPLPEGLPEEHGALIEPLAVALHAVRRVNAVAGQRVLVIGGGPIGQSVLLALQIQGVTDVAVSEIDAGRRELCARLGATTLDPADGPIADQLDGAFGRPADASIDAVGLAPTVAEALRATRFGGSVCLVGMGARTMDLDAYRISTEERALVGSFAYSVPDFTDAASWAATAPELLEPLISRQVAPEQADDTFRALASGDGTAGKVLVRFDR